MTLVSITEVVEECANTRSLFFDLDGEVKPGQFVMVWIPGVDEIPLSLSYCGGRRAITVENVGPATSALCGLEAGAKIGIRGPFGNGFSVQGDRVLVVSGGCGTAPLAPLIEQMGEEGKTVVCAIGAHSECGLLFAQRVQKSGAVVRLATDDGSLGYQGYVTDVAAELMKEQDFDQVYCCGPEPMMVKMVAIASSAGKPIQCSLERYMKCGIGICDSCSLDGLQVCRDGPIFDGQILSGSSDFGSIKRDKSGRRLTTGD